MWGNGKLFYVLMERGMIFSSLPKWRLFITFPRHVIDRHELFTDIHDLYGTCILVYPNVNQGWTSMDCSRRLFLNRTSLQNGIYKTIVTKLCTMVCRLYSKSEWVTRETVETIVSQRVEINGKQLITIL